MGDIPFPVESSVFNNPVVAMQGGGGAREAAEGSAADASHHVEAEGLGGDQVRRERRVGGRRVQARRPVALPAHSAHSTAHAHAERRTAHARTAVSTPERTLGVRAGGGAAAARWGSAVAGGGGGCEPM